MHYRNKIKDDSMGICFGNAGVYSGT